ncbi:uncharacterized protein LOC125506372 [Triticum urartu]|uniref:uncharacterized protein LOC125506372 n=1 Tax=Triticum urartu TaxID=4572 RepID=UPI002042DD5E|nr:uncharacterized protein LOC125506372 [Triticum urartu]
MSTWGSIRLKESWTTLGVLSPWQCKVNLLHLLHKHKRQRLFLLRPSLLQPCHTKRLPLLHPPFRRLLLLFKAYPKRLRCLPLLLFKAHPKRLRCLLLLLLFKAHPKMLRCLLLLCKALSCLLCRLLLHVKTVCLITTRCLMVSFPFPSCRSCSSASVQAPVMYMYVEFD